MIWCPYFSNDKTRKRLALERLSEIEPHNCRCYFRGFQLELHIVDTKNFEIGSVVAKLQLLEVVSQSDDFLGKTLPPLGDPGLMMMCCMDECSVLMLILTIPAAI